MACSGILDDVQYCPGISYLTFVGDNYITEDYDISYAGFLANLFMFGSLLCSPLAGYPTDKIGKQEYFLMGRGYRPGSTASAGTR